MKKVVNAQGKETWVSTQGILTAESFEQKNEQAKWWVRLNYGEKLGTTLLGYFNNKADCDSIIASLLA